MSIYEGPRDGSFVETIKKVLLLGNLNDVYLNSLLSEDALMIYSEVFTHSSANPRKNYEVFEILGDSSVGRNITWYMYRRFPQLDCPEGVKVLARLLINYGSKKSFYPIAEKLGFWNFISASTEIRATRKKALLEDVLEAFIGATEYLLDRKVMYGVGGAVSYDIVRGIFNTMQISLDYISLYDAVTRLKELVEYHKSPIIQKLENTSSYPDGKGYKLHEFTISIITKEGRRDFKSTSSDNKIAKENASEQAYNYLWNLGYTKPIPQEYIEFQKVKENL